MLIETLNVKGKEVKIYADEIPEDPREWDNLGTMAFFHRRYNLGDKHDFYNPDELIEFLNEENTVELPVYMYDHSGIGLSTDNSRYPFNCPWDSGMLGYIYITRDEIKEEFPSWKVLTKNRINKIKSYLQGEVETYHYFVSGRVYYFVSTCERCGNTDSCGGFYGEEWEENGLLHHCDYYCHCQERSYNNLVEIQE